MLNNSPEIEQLKREAEELLGAEDLKRYVNDVCGLYAYVQEDRICTLFERALLLSVSEGDGLNTWLSIIARLWEFLLDMDHVSVFPYTLKLPDLMNAGSMQKTSDRDIVLHTIEEDGVLESIFGRRILCVDITAWIDRVEGADFRAVLSRLKQSMEDQFVVFRIPAVDAVTLRRIREAIGWFMNVDALYCPPFTIDDYLIYAMRRLERSGIRVEAGVTEPLREIITNERRDRGFCGFKTVRRITDELTFAALRNACAEKGREDGHE
ncbi:MAG: hypothetical protein K6G16_08760 [Lachnospiraceae bacterium]|nr:hypothetical protein [Lachnospiraceae bacterium]